jgi:hypothetical protein
VLDGYRWKSHRNFTVWLSAVATAEEHFVLLPA